jgi:hypothetical protein
MKSVIMIALFTAACGLKPHAKPGTADWVAQVAVDCVEISKDDGALSRWFKQAKLESARCREYDKFKYQLLAKLHTACQSCVKSVAKKVLETLKSQCFGNTKYDSRGWPPTSADVHYWAWKALSETEWQSCRLETVALGEYEDNDWIRKVLKDGYGEGVGKVISQVRSSALSACLKNTTTTPDYLEDQQTYDKGDAARKLRVLMEGDVPGGANMTPQECLSALDAEARKTEEFFLRYETMVCDLNCLKVFPSRSRALERCIESNCR